MLVHAVDKQETGVTTSFIFLSLKVILVIITANIWIPTIYQLLCKYDSFLVCTWQQSSMVFINNFQIIHMKICDAKKLNNSFVIISPDCVTLSSIDTCICSLPLSITSKQINTKSVNFSNWTSHSTHVLSFITVYECWTCQQDQARSYIDSLSCL